MDKRIGTECGIYSIEVDGKHYIGSSKDVHNRLNQHKRMLSTGNHYSKKMQKKFDSGSTFRYTVLETTKTISRLIILESYYIGLHNSVNDGYNSSIPRRHIRDAEKQVVYSEVVKEMEDAFIRLAEDYVKRMKMYDLKRLSSSIIDKVLLDDEA